MIYRRIISLYSVFFCLLLVFPHLAFSGQKVIKDYLGKAPMYQMTQVDATANVILFSGGPGWWGNLKSKNFLIRERESFFSKGMNLYLFPNKKKKYRMTYDDRLQDEHIDRIRELVRVIRNENNLPIFLAGISRGAVSTGRYITQYGAEVDGAILLSAIYYNLEITKKNDYSMQEIIGNSAATNILIVHHEDDCCKLCQPSSAKQFFDELMIKGKALKMFSGGGSSGNCNGPFHHHGFEGIENKVVEEIVSWISSIK